MSDDKTLIGYEAEIIKGMYLSMKGDETLDIENRDSKVRVLTFAEVAHYSGLDNLELAARDLLGMCGRDKLFVRPSRDGNTFRFCLSKEGFEKAIELLESEASA